jgi:hypothetical protein
MPTYFINGSRTSVSAATPAAAVAKSLRDAGYRASRVMGRLRVTASRATVETTNGVAVVRSEVGQPVRVIISVKPEMRLRSKRHAARSNPATSRKKASDPGASRVKVYRGRARVSDDGFGNDAYYTLEGSRVKVAMANPRAHSWDESGGSDRDGEFILLRTNLRDARAVLEPLGYVVRAFRR